MNEILSLPLILQFMLVTMIVAFFLTIAAFRSNKRREAEVDARIAVKKAAAEKLNSDDRLINKKDNHVRN